MSRTEAMEAELAKLLEAGKQLKDEIIARSKR